MYYLKVAKIQVGILSFYLYSHNPDLFYEVKNFFDNNKYAIDQQNENGDTALHITTEYSNVECVYFLLENNADMVRFFAESIGDIF